MPALAIALVALGCVIVAASRGSESAGPGEESAVPTLTVPPDADSDATQAVERTGFLRFDGVDDYVDLNELDVGGAALTIEAWIHSQDLRNCPAGDCRILSKALGIADDDHVWMLSTIEVDSEIRLRLRLRVNGTTETLIASTGNLAEGMWNHVAGTYDGSHVRLFLDGDEVGARELSGPISGAAGVEVWVGGNPSGASDRPWRGSIDELRVWNVARTRAELVASLRTELVGNEPGLVAYYRFNAGEGDLDRVSGTRAIFGSGAGADVNDPTTAVGHDSALEPDDMSQLGAAPDASNPDWDPDPLGGVCTFTNGNEPTDDPNPDFDGTLGRFRVSSALIPSGYPTPLTTGLCGVGLTPAELIVVPGITIEEDGAVFDGYDFTGSVVVEANNVTIRNSRITSTGLYPLHLRPGFTNFLVEDTRIRGVGEGVSNAVYIQGEGATLRRVHASGGSDGFRPTSGPFVLEDSYYAGSYRQEGTEGSGSGSHNDVIQIRAGSNFIVRHNTLLGPYQMSTSAIIVQAKAGDISDVLIERNYLSGGGYTVYTTATDPYTLSDAVVSENRFELGSWLHGSVRNSGGATYIDNTEIPS